MSGQGQGDIVKELPHAALVHNRTEQDEQEDVAGGYAYGRAVDTFRVGKEMVGQGRPVVPPVHEHAGELAAEEPVYDKDQRQNRQRIACDPAGTFQYQHYQQRGHDQVGLVGVAGPFHHAQIIMPDVEGDGETEQGQDPVDNGRLGMVGALEAGIHQKAHGSNHCHMQGTVYQGNRRPKGRGVQMVSGNQKTKDVEKFCHLARKLPGGGFLVQLLYNLL